MNPGRIKLLVVEDNPADRALYRIYLKHIAGLEIEEAALGSAALELCRSWGPDCVLLDFTLPDMNGLEFIDRLRAAAGKIPCAVVMLTGIADERVAVRAVNAGATDYVPKSENMESVLEHSIFNAIDKYRLASELEMNRAELARSEHLHRSLMKALPQLVWTADAACRISFGNRQWWDYLGIPSDAPGGFQWNTVLHIDDRERWWRNWRERQQSASPFDIEVRLRRAADQQYRWHLIRAVRLTDLPEVGPAEAGLPAGKEILGAEWLATCTDIEDQKRTEQAMAQRQKWDSIGLLAGGIAHDFNNLLVGILGGASYVSDSLPPSHPTQTILQNIVTSGERAAHLTRQLLAYAGKGAFFIQQVDLSAVAEQTCELIRSSVPNNVQLHIQTTPGLPKIETDSGQVQQVVMNLVLNAVESIPQSEGGAVFVRTFADAADSREPAVVLEVRDNGRGMDAETQSRIFDPFFTTKFTGRGLGLAAVQGILRSSGAAIDVSSSPGKGSVFRVRFRASGASSGAAPETTPAARHVPPNAAATILVVDDEPAVLKVCRTALERAGCSVLLAEDGPRALRFIEEKGDGIQLMLLDLGMPGMSGRQVLEKKPFLAARLAAAVAEILEASSADSANHAVS